MSLYRQLWRARNIVRRITAGVPRGIVSPVVRNDLFHAWDSLFGFLSAFGSGRSALVIGPQAGYGGFAVAQAGAASTTAVIPSRRVRSFAERSYQAPGLAFVDELPREGMYDVIVSQGGALLKERLTPGGELVVTVPSSAAAPALLSQLRDQFRTVRRFAQTRLTTVDLASPFPSHLSSESFAFRELVDDDAGHDAVTIIVLATDDDRWRDLKLHLGCGPIALPGWINVDNQPYPSIDFRWDLARGVPFREAHYIFAEHFIEHLSYDQAETFLRNCRQALRDDGILRLSTPNLDWVWGTSYHPYEWANDDEPLRDCFVLNRAFRGWGHQFLYNIQTLTALLHDVGFGSVRKFDYGESDTPVLAGIERHEKYHEVPELPHILIVEASGRGTAAERRTEPYVSEYRRDVAVK